MQYQSTRDHALVVSSSEAILRGLTPDGGLFVPVSFPQADLEAWRSLDYPALAAAVLQLYLTDYDPAFLRTAAREAYGTAFGGKAGQTVQVRRGLPPWNSGMARHVRSRITRCS